MKNIKVFDIEKLFTDKSLIEFNSGLPKPLDSDSSIFTLYARNGLYHIAKEMLKLAPEKSLALVPAYSCGDEIESISRAGYEVVPYRVNANLQVDLSDVKTKINRRTGVLLVTHYFGFPQLEIVSTKGICEKSGMFLIEDCAHSFGGAFNKVPLGLYGDVSIFSLRKFLDVPHGGALVINNENLTYPKFRKPSSEAVSLDLLIYLRQKYGLSSRGIPINVIYEQLGMSYTSKHGPRLESFGGYDLCLSNLAKMIIRNTDVNKLLESRIRNFNKYLEVFCALNERKAVPLFSKIPEGVVPLNFPVMVRDSEKTYGNLRKIGIDFCQPFWSYLHKYVEWVKYPEALSLKRGIVSLSLDEDVRREDVVRMLTAV